MSSVKRDLAREELQVPLLMGLLFREVRTIFANEDWDGLRMSHVRVISSVPPEGISVTELAERVGMSKQGCGQFVTGLEATGQVSVEQDPSDRRVRLVRRTAKGNRTISAVTRRILAIEQDWADRVGERRYRTFRTVLEELALEQ
jgi:DNA-binding MarR family transcriptional regulator